MIPLSAGALENISQGVDVDSPVLQVLGTKRLASSDSERYRLLLSDGVTSTSFTMLATQLNGMVKSGELSDNSIVQITRYALSNANNAGKQRKIMVILGIEVKVPGSQVNGRIGQPTQAEKSSSNTGENMKPNSTQNIPKATPTPAPRPAGNANQKRRLNDTINSGTDIVTSPIAALSPYQNKWVIKVRVASKTGIKNWSNSRGEGKLFNMLLVDESGEIRCTGFTDVVDKFYDMLEVGKVYYLSRGLLKPANKAFNNTNNDYEMNLTTDTEILLCHDTADDIPMLTYNFTPISEIEALPKDQIIDVLGVVKSHSGVQVLTARSTGRELHKRDLNLVDITNTLITLSLWGQQADEFEASENSIVAAKGVKIGEFNNGKNLSVISSSVIQVEPDIPEAHSLRGWYNTVGQNEEAKSLSKAGGSGPNAEWATLQEGHDKSLASPENSPVFLCKAAISLIRSDRALYKACPVETCKKKVVDQSNGMFRCEKCQREFPNFRYRLLTNLHIADWSSNQWVTAFGEESEKILGMTSQELGELNENQPDQYNDKFAEVAFIPFLFKLSLRMETYADEARIRGVVRTVDPMNYKLYNKHLAQELKKLANVHNVN
ncbi:replication protein A 70 kDa DNA-binding subunit isoform X2 [Chelonus insularis]|uniref:replication protein A 70 kDa DNA-binding subunit isoform X2 n=1 Tax=Chelonus insularis TaxID=460826 RepID=UPI00158D894C|nr:replication protein A 70 kDa DNA-binding subunit isoform X2 [Chelonus insularis]